MHNEREARAQDQEIELDEAIAFALEAIKEVGDGAAGVRVSPGRER